MKLVRRAKAQQQIEKISKIKQARPKLKRPSQNEAELQFWNAYEDNRSESEIKFWETYEA
tara:strand:- start:3246 stop:3425 length:180 start_codon:yes stop_codon:yes gene_type:complete